MNARYRPSMKIRFGLALVLTTALLGAGLGSTAGAAGSRAPTHSPASQVTASKKSTGPLSFPATGYFNTAQANGRWYLVTPTGQPFYADGVDSVTAGGEVDQSTGQCPYCEAIAAEYPNTAAWDTATLARLRSWGFDSLGDYSDDSTLGTQMPFTVQLEMASGDDWFAPSFVSNADAVAAAEIPQYADNPNVIGYFTDSELNWGPPDTGTNTALQNYLELPAGSPGLAVAQQYVGNPNGFVYALAQRYFSVTTAAVRMYDPNHLILGVKAEGQEIQPELLEAAKGYVNVFSIEDYELQPGFAQIILNLWPQYLPVEPTLADMEQYFGGPMMIGEYSFLAPNGYNPNTDPGIYYVSANQQARADDYANFVAPLYEDAPWMVGDEFFQYEDEPSGGRVGDGENDNFGLVNIDDQPYPDMVSAASLIHSILPDRVGQPGTVCDSWAQGADGVVCNATMSDQSYPVSIMAEPLLGATQGTAYSDTVYAGGGLPSYKFALTQGSLPKGLKLNKTGTISGTPKSAGTSTFTLQVTDSSGSTSTQGESITVGPDTPVWIKTNSLGHAVDNSAYTETLKADGGTEPYAWSISSGTLPTGLSLDPDGQLSGVPMTSGTFTFTIQVTDSTATPSTATKTYSLTVKPSS